MNVFLDDFLVGLVLLAGFGYAAYALGPRSVRAGLLTAMSWLLRRAPGVLGLGGIAARLASAASLKAKGCCGGCDGCAAAPPATGTSAAGTPTPSTSAAPEVRIPVSTIGQRARR